jgi:UDPglucose 6-dehydrogenase
MTTVMTKQVRNVKVFGAGFVGFANGLVYSKKYNVEFIECDVEKISLINRNSCPIEDQHASGISTTNWENITATNVFPKDFKNCHLVIIAVPTNYDVNLNQFDVKTLEETLHNIRKYDCNVPILIKSTIPIGFTERFSKDNNYKDIYFSPEFLQEGSAIIDAENPTRIILSPKNDSAEFLLNELVDLTESEVSDCLLMDTTEAESVKLFANGYLAMRVAFFNELDTFCLTSNLETKSVIEGICLDKRIGMYYNNPSFGFGGYCFPKDTQQLREQVGASSSKIIKNIHASNELRMEAIARHILKKFGTKIGIYKLAMKSGTKNARSSSMVRVIQHLASNGCTINVFDPDNSNFDFGFDNIIEVNSLSELDDNSDVILINRITDQRQYQQFTKPIFTRDIFNCG